MDVLNEYINNIEDLDHRSKMAEVLKWIIDNYPVLTPKIAWNQPMFTHHGTFILGLSVAKKHFSVSPERKTMIVLEKEIVESGLDFSKQLVRFPWTEKTNFELIRKFIEFNIEDKKDINYYWRKETD